MKPLPQMTDDELKEAFRSSDDSTAKLALLEIHRRIDQKDKSPHSETCLCVNCTEQE